MKILRPKFPPGYLENPKTLLTWDYVERRLTEAKNYWLCSTRPTGRPHVVPRWAVWLGGQLYYDGSPETRHARNIAANAQVVVHLESGDEALIVEGEAHAAPKPTPALAQQLAVAYAAKYATHGYSPTPDQWDQGGLFVITPRTVLAWTKFTDDPTKFILDA